VRAAGERLSFKADQPEQVRQTGVR
jgi:hypothetical protein